MSDTISLNGKRILVVDDEPDILGVLEDLLDMCEVVKGVPGSGYRHIRYYGCQRLRTAQNCEKQKNTGCHADCPCLYAGQPFQDN